MAEEIKVTISPTGEISYSVRGVKGKSCKDLTRAIDALGQVTSDKNTPEFCELPNRVQVKQGQG